MKVLKEVTDTWTTDFMPNHTYLLKGEKILAYRPWHDDAVQHLSGKMRLDRARRKFKELPFVAAEWGLEEQSAPSNIVVIEGSNGNTYEVDVEAGTCTCPGHQFRGKCKHIEMAKLRVDSIAA